MNATQLKHLEEGLRDPESIITPEKEDDFNERVKQILWY